MCKKSLKLENLKREIAELCKTDPQSPKLIVLRKEYMTLDRELAFTDGRYKVIPAKARGNSVVRLKKDLIEKAKAALKGIDSKNKEKILLRLLNAAKNVNF